jgi:hypothetical protein
MKVFGTQDRPLKLVLNGSPLPEAIPLISICDSCSDTMFRFAGSLGLRSLQVEFQADNPVRSDKTFGELNGV